MNTLRTYLIRSQEPALGPTYDEAIAALERIEAEAAKRGTPRSLSDSEPPPLVPPGIDPATGMRYSLGDDPMQPQPALSPEAVPEVPSEPPASVLREHAGHLLGVIPPDLLVCDTCELELFGGEATGHGAGDPNPPSRAEPERERASHTHELKIGAREYDPDGVVQTWQMYCVACDQAGRFTIPDEEKDWIEPERERAGDPLDVAWKEVADAVVDRPYPYPGTDTNGGWCIQLFGYPPTSIGGTPETRYHAMATPAIDSHHRNTVKATGPTPTSALQALLTALSSQSPVGAERTPTATSDE